MHIGYKFLFENIVNYFTSANKSGGRLRERNIAIGAWRGGSPAPPRRKWGTRWGLVQSSGGASEEMRTEGLLLCPPQYPQNWQGKRQHGVYTLSQLGNPLVVSIELCFVGGRTCGATQS